MFDQELEAIVNQDPEVLDMENQLEELKQLNLNKKDLQVRRNRLTAQLSRNKKKTEYDYMKSQFIQMRESLLTLQEILNNNQKYNICQNCKKNIIQNEVLKNSIRVKIQQDKNQPKKKNQQSTNITSSQDNSQKSSTNESSYISSQNQIGSKRMKLNQSIFLGLAVVSLIGMLGIYNQDINSYSQNNKRILLDDYNETYHIFNQDQDNFPITPIQFQNVKEGKNKIFILDDQNSLNLTLNKNINNNMEVRNLINENQQKKFLPDYYKFDSIEQKVKQIKSDNYSQLLKSSLAYQNEVTLPYIQSTVYCKNENILILPQAGIHSIKPIYRTENDNIFYNQEYLQIIVPRNQLTILNQNGQKVQENKWGVQTCYDYPENEFLEIICSIDEVNKMRKNNYLPK